MEYDNKQSFVLFLEQEKKSEKSPDYTGTYTDEHGKEWRMAAWKRVSKGGKPFLSGKVSEFAVEKKGYESAKAVYETFKKPDVVLEDIGDEPIDLSEIPF